MFWLICMHNCRDRVYGLEFGVQGGRFGIEEMGLDFLSGFVCFGWGVAVRGSGFGVWGLRAEVWGSGLKVQGLGFRV